MVERRVDSRSKLHQIFGFLTTHTHSAVKSAFNQEKLEFNDL